MKFLRRWQRFSGRELPEGFYPPIYRLAGKGLLGVALLAAFCLGLFVPALVQGGSVVVVWTLGIGVGYLLVKDAISEYKIRKELRDAKWEDIV